jgi:hypothetical protein
MLRIKFKEDQDEDSEHDSFGTIHDLDGTVYNAVEIRIHTPGKLYFQ